MPEPRPIVRFEPTGVTTPVDPGTTLREAAAAVGVHVPFPCGGLGTCGRCRVVAAGALAALSGDEATLLTGDEVAAGVRLACRARVAGDVTVTIPGTAAGPATRIVEYSEAAAPTVEPPASRGVTGAGTLAGAAVDVGTTTLVVRLLDLATGELLGSDAELNPQRGFGDDVLSRISAAARSGVGALRDPLIVALEALFERLLSKAGLGAEALREIAVCGNPTMVHLLLGIDPSSLGVAPYEPVLVGSVDLGGGDLGFAGYPNARVHVLPGISGFVGGDVVAGLLATSLDLEDATALLVDLGTNGEIVLRTPEGLFATSAAAGPALEGAEISAGMLAEAGAIERVELTADGIEFAVIGGGQPRGICGSGLLDLVAALLDAGVLDPTGLLRPDAAHPLASRVGERDGVRVFDVAPGVVLTQPDVRQVQLAVAAVATGIGELLDAATTSPEDVAALVVAGGFGLHAGARALARLGVIPVRWVSRTRFAGNAALAGTAMALLDTAARRRADALARHVSALDLASRPHFQARFIAAMTFPEV